MYLRLKLGCKCGCSYEIEASNHAEFTDSCPNCGYQISSHDAKCLRDLLEMADLIHLDEPLTTIKFVNHPRT